jgi:hypothetical protein
MNAVHSFIILFKYFGITGSFSRLSRHFTAEKSRIIVFNRPMMGDWTLQASTPCPFHARAIPLAPSIQSRLYHRVVAPPSNLPSHQLYLKPTISCIELPRNINMPMHLRCNTPFCHFKERPQSAGRRFFTIPFTFNKQRVVV